MAEAFFNHFAKGNIYACSAGPQPAKHRDRNVVQAMKEKGIDISLAQSKKLDSNVILNCDCVIVVGSGMENTAMPSMLIPIDYWPVGDPEGQPIATVRLIRDEVEKRIKHLLDEILN